MIRQYKEHCCLETFGEGGLVYEASKQNEAYLLYEFEEYCEADSYHFEIIKKIKCSKILPIVNEFTENGTHYIVTKYAASTLQKIRNSSPKHILSLSVALDYFSKIVLGLEELHNNKLIYRNIRLQTFKVDKNQIYFSDFTFSQFSRRKQRLFQIIGCSAYLAPEFFSQDGCGKEVDIWAAGVLLFVMLFNQYPFNFGDKSEKACIRQFKKKCLPTFELQNVLKECKNPANIKANKVLSDFFRRIFECDYSQRITIKEIKKHPLFEDYFPFVEEQKKSEYLSVIGEESEILQSQYFLLSDFAFGDYLENEKVLFEFMEKFCEDMNLTYKEFFPEEAILKVQFSVAKIAIERINRLSDVLYGKRKPHFLTSSRDWETFQGTTAIKVVIEELEREKKTINSIMKSALLQLPPQQNPFYGQEIPQTFSEGKKEYRENLSFIFTKIKKEMQKFKKDKKMQRKLYELIVKIFILHFINHVFESNNYESDFASYISWNKNKKLENLDTWIHSQKVSVLKKFFHHLNDKYQ